MENVNISYENSGISELEKGFLNILPSGYESYVDISRLSELGLDALVREVIAIASGRSGEVASFFMLVLGVSLIASLASFVSSPISPAVRGGVAAAASLAVFLALYPLFEATAESLEALTGFFSALVPTLTAYLALGGGSASALGAASGLSLTLWFTALIGGSLLLPLTAASFASSTVSSTLGGVSERVGIGVGRSVKRVIGGVGAVLAAVFSLQTFVSVAADGVKMRAAKYAAGNLIPMVGSSVSGALSALGGGLSAVGGIIGASSVAVIVAMSLSPLVLLLLYRLALYLSSVALELSSSGADGPIKSFMNSLDILISVYITTIIIYIFEIILIVKGGAAVFGAT